MCSNLFTKNRGRWDEWDPWEGGDCLSNYTTSTELSCTGNRVKGPTSDSRGGTPEPLYMVTQGTQPHARRTDEPPQESYTVISCERNIFNASLRDTVFFPARCWSSASRLHPQMHVRKASPDGVCSSARSGASSCTNERNGVLFV